MKFKDGVELFYDYWDDGGIPWGVKPETIRGMHIVANIYKSLGKELTVTSVCDGEHKNGSKHYQGLAFDCRTWRDSTGVQMTPKEKEVLAKYCRDALGDDWDVVIEKTHMHVEYDSND